MKKNKNLVLWLVIVLVAIAVTLMGCSSGGAEAAAEVPEKKDVVTVHASVPMEWLDNGAVRLWAWKEGGEDVFEAWPGETLIPDDYGWFTATVPGWVDRVIINGFDGAVQTADLAVDAGYDIWVVVHDDLTADIYYEDVFSDDVEHNGLPEKKDVVTVRASVPVEWLDNGAVGLWAWKEGGEDVFEAWPGETLIPDDYGWFTATVPGWVDRVIINGFDGAVQTADLAVDAGYDIWVLVYDDLTADIFYEDIFSDYVGDAEYIGLPEGMGDDPFVQAALAEDFETMKELLPTVQDRSILTDWTFNDFNYWYASEAVRAGDYATAIEFFDYCAYEDNHNYARIFEHLVAGDVEGALDVLISMGFTMLDGDLDMEWSEIIQKAAGMEFAEGSTDAILWEKYITRRMWTNQPSFKEDSLVFGEPSNWEAEGHIGEIQGSDYYLPVDNLNALYAQCGSEANGKILVIRSQKSYPQGSTYYAVDLPVMEYLSYDLYPASLAEVEYILEVNYDYSIAGNYKQTLSSDHAAVTDYFAFLRMKGQVVLKEAVGGKTIQKSQWIQGTGEVDAHFSELDYQCSNMPETGADIISAVEKVRQLNAG